MLPSARRAGHLLEVAGCVLGFTLLIAIGIGPHTGAYRTLTVLTGSMAPGMAPGSIAIVRPIPPSSLRVGDVLTYNAPVDGRPIVTHRITEILEPGPHPLLRTKGDANPNPDDWTFRISGDRAWVRWASVPAVGRGITTMRAPHLQMVFLKLGPPLLALVWLAEIWTGDTSRRRTRTVLFETVRPS